jgi:GTP cyclohydrolase I
MCKVLEFAVLLHSTGAVRICAVKIHAVHTVEAVIRGWGDENCTTTTTTTSGTYIN